MKQILIILFLCIGLICQAKTYYVKNGGSDVADGLTPATAWATIARVNTENTSGDTVLFRCASTWRMEQLDCDNGSAGNYSYYGSYDAGDKPLFLGSKEENGLTDWTDLGGNIWQNNDGSFTTEVGNIVLNGNHAGIRIIAASPTLDAQGEWWYDYTNDLIRIYSVGNPATYYTDIECCISYEDAIKREAIQYVILQNLRFDYWGSNGIYMTNGANKNQFLDLELNYIGGDDMDDSDATPENRYGNGITCYNGASNILIERCLINQVYDSGISPQGQNTYTYDVNNWSIRNNIITNCEISYEYWFRERNEPPTYIGTITVDSIIFENNTCRNAGYGWCSNQRVTGYSYGCHVLVTNSDNSGETNIIIRNNIFDGCDLKPYHFSVAADTDDISINYNVVTDGLVYFARIASTSYSTFAQWRAITPHDDNSYNESPQLEGGDPYNYLPKSTSPAINHGYNNGLTKDYREYSRTVPIDIGAYEFDGTPVTGSFGFGKNASGNFLKNANGQFIILPK